MRLTLRTMLAHLDGILDPADSEELGRKIAENEFASSLAQRIADCTRRLRLSAPKVLGKGTALDPNTVAEYLDSTLPAERMPDFEKVCLESDIHLAEVAACHHILTMIVGQPAHVEPESRRRMYRLASGADDESATPEIVAEAAMTAPPASVEIDGHPTKAEPARAKPKVPDYLREGVEQRRMTMIAVVMVAAAVTIGVLFMKDKILAALGLGSETPVAQGDSNASAGATPKAPAPAAATNESAGAGESNKDNAADGANATATGDASKPSPLPRNETPSKSPTKPDAPSADADAAKPPAPGEKSPPDVPMPVEPTDTPAAIPRDTVPPVDGPQQPPIAPRPARLDPVGTLASTDQLLVRFDTKEGEWVRVADGGAVFAGDRIVAIPTFRPKILFSGGVAVELVADSHDGTIVELIAPAGDAPPGVRVVHGRLSKISAGGRQNAKMRLVLGKFAATITLADPTTMLALDVYRNYEPGQDPMGMAEPLAANFLVTSGSVDIQPDGGRVLTVNENMKVLWTANGKAEPQPLSGGPEWLDRSRNEMLDVRAANELMRNLKPSTLFAVKLDEQIHGQRREERSFAVRACGVLDRFDPLVAAALKDDRSDWTYREKAIAALVAGVFRGPEAAAVVRAALAKEFGGRNGGVLYRMLCGYSAADLKAGGDAKLVENLENESVAFRSLAIYNLKWITGVHLGYRPELSTDKEKVDSPLRRGWANKWRERLQRGSIIWAAVPAEKPAAAKLPAAKPAGKAEPKPASGRPATPAPPAPPAPMIDDPSTPPPPAAGADGR